MTSGGAPAARRALVVGNSDGVGLAFTRHLLDEGWVVMGVLRRAAPIVHASYEHAVLDVAAPGYRDALAALCARSGPFDACVYCAGVGELFDPSDLTREAHTLRVNLVAAVETVETVLPAMLAAGRGHFVGLSSIGDGCSPEAPSYAASKAGLSSYLGGLALALRGRGVAVTNVRFGFVDTKMAKSPVRPMMVPPGRAADVLVRCLRTRPAQITYPKPMGALMHLL